MFAYDRTMLKKKGNLVKNIQKIWLLSTATGTEQIQRSKFTWNIPLEFMPRKKNWTLFGPYDLKKKLTKTTVAPNMRMMKNVYKRYVMPLIKSKMKTVNWKKKKKIEYILAKYFLFSFSWKIFHRNKWQQVKYTFCCKKDKTKTGSLLTMNILHLFINYQILTNEINTPGIKFLF